MCAYIVSKGVSTPPPPFSKFPPPQKKIGFPNFLKSPSPPPIPPTLPANQSFQVFLINRNATMKLGSINTIHVK